MISSRISLPFADGYEFREGRLFAGTVDIGPMIDAVGTPVYVYNLDAVGARFLEWKDAFGSIPHQVCFAVKSNSSLALLHHLADLGCGFDVNSRGELFRVRLAGAEVGRVTMTGVGKTREDIEAALQAGVRFLNVESFEECRHIQAVAAEMGIDAPVILRINPEVDARTHPYIATGLAEHKFGITAAEARGIIPALREMPNLRLMGFGMHIGSQILEPSPYLEAAQKLFDFVYDVRRILPDPVSIINLGGGLGVAYHAADRPMSIALFLNALGSIIRRFQREIDENISFTVEPGRQIAANAGILVTRVLYVKRSGKKTFVIVDAGMNELIRPTLYDAHHEILPVRQHRASATIVADIVGPVCETGDYFAMERSLPGVTEGDYLAIFSCGAYGSVMSSRYNSRPFAAEVVVRGPNFFIARERETLEEMVGKERMINDIRNEE